MIYTLLQSTVDIRGNLDGLGSGPKFQSDLGTIVTSFIGLAMVVGALGTLLYMILGGVKWITAGGDKGKVEQAREMIMQGVIGLTVLVVAFALFGMVDWWFGLEILSNNN